MKPRWLDRGLVFSPIYLTLCTTPKQFEAELRRMNVPRSSWPDFVPPPADACVHKFEVDHGRRRCAIVNIKTGDMSGTAIAGLLVHEAVHVWQWVRESIGESAPSSEFEAYSIGGLAQSLMEEYARQVVPSGGIEPPTNRLQGGCSTN